MITEAFNYKSWADENILRAIGSINKNAFPDSYAFVLQQINHIVIVEDLFKSRLTNAPAPHKNTNSEIVPEFDELKHRLEASNNWYLSYGSTLDDNKRQET